MTSASPSVPRGGEWLGWRGMILLSVAFVAVYSPTAQFDFVWDDLREARDNPLLDGPFLEGLTASQIEHQGIAASDVLDPVHDSYRPVRYASYRLDRALAGTSPGAMHVHNVVLGLLAVWAVWWLLLEWGLAGAHAFVGAAVFALHPAQVECVAYISGRSDLHAGIAAACTAAATMRGARSSRKGWYALAALAFLLCLASKEAYLGLPLVLGLWLLTRHQLREGWPAVVGQLTVAVGWLLIRSQVVAQSGSSHLAEALAQAGGIVAQLGLAFLGPFGSSPVRPLAATTPWLGTGLLAALGLLLLLAWWRRRDALRADLFVGVSWFVLLIGPSVLAAQIFGTLSDRYLYAPIVGLVVAGGVLMGRLRDRGRAMALVTRAAFGLWAAALMFVTTVQVQAWRSPRTLAEHSVRMTPEAAKGWLWLGAALAKEGGCRAAVPAFRRAAELDPSYPVAWNNLAVCAMRSGRLEEALGHAQRAVEAGEGTYAVAWFNLGQVHEASGRRTPACDAYRAALRLDPGHRPARAAQARLCPTSAE